MKFKTRRLIGNEVRLVGRTPEDYAQELQELLEDLRRAVVGSIPGGFNGIAPAILSLNAAAAAGSESDGWTPPSHVHALDLLLTTKGDLLSYNGSVYVRVGLAGAPDGHALVAKAAEPAGWKWDSVGWVDDGTGVRLATATDFVAIGQATQMGTNKLSVLGGVRIENVGGQAFFMLGAAAKARTDSADAVAFQLAWVKSRSGGACSAGDIIGDFAFNFFNSAPAEYQGSVFRSTVLDPTAGSEDTDYQFYTSAAGAVGLRMILHSVGMGVGTAALAHSRLQVAGPLAPAYASTSVDLTLDNTHSTVAVDTSGGNRIITLPTAAGIAGRIYTIKRITAGANTLTVDANGAQTIDGALTVLLPTQWDVVRVQSDGANWLII